MTMYMTVEAFVAIGGLIVAIIALVVDICNNHKKR